MQSQASAETTTSFFQSAAFGALCGLFAAVGYTACNACLRAVTGVDPFFVSTLRAVPTIVILAPIVALRPAFNKRILPPVDVTIALGFVGAVAHLGGNSLFQYSLGVIGMALAVPLCLGFMIISGATLGRVVLKEPITPRLAAALLLLIGSVFVLSGGADAAHKAVEKQEWAAGELPAASSSVTPPWQTALGASAACLSGLFYASLGATIRNYARDRSTVAQTLTIVSTAGLIALIVVCSTRLSLADLQSYSTHDYLMMTAAGTLNAIAFIALTRALQLTSLVYVHGLNASQAAMAAVTGVFLFEEAVTPYLLAGLSLTIAGLLLMQRARPRPTE